MNQISLSKMRQLYDKVVILLEEETVDKEYYTGLISEVQRVENIVRANKSNFGEDCEKIITLCLALIYSLRIKITEILECPYKVKAVYH